MTIKDENYINIQGWMVTELNLKGNELLIYALIYGFSQAEGQTYNGGLQYLADWTNSTKQGVIKNLKSLVEKGYIGKNETIINNIKFCEYYVTKFNGVLNNVERGIKQSLTGGIKQSLPNNKSKDNKTDNKIDNKENIIKEIIDHLNSKANTKYKATTDKTKKCINARLNEGFTLDDFKNVIDIKTTQWLGTEWEQYLRPETLFGTKFESYLNTKIESIHNKQPQQEQSNKHYFEKDGIKYLEEDGILYYYDCGLYKKVITEEDIKREEESKRQAEEEAERLYQETGYRF